MLYKTRKNYQTQDQTKTFKGCCVAVSREDMHSHFLAIQNPVFWNTLYVLETTV